MTPEEALSKLREMGLLCRIPKEHSKHFGLYIQGGMREFDANGIRGFEDAFGIIEEDGVFHAMVTGFRVGECRFFDDEVDVATLGEAVAAVIRIYHGRLVGRAFHGSQDT